jgi:protein-tyrosine phosphatase
MYFYKKITSLSHRTMNQQITYNKRSISFLFAVVFFMASCQLLPAQTPGTSMGVESLPNLRDLGGYKTSDSSSIRRSMLYRSNQLNHISTADMQKLTALKWKTDFDLRTVRERTSKPDELPSGVRNVSLDMLADASEEAWVKLGDLLNDPKHVSKAAGGGTAEAITTMKQVYCDMVTLPSSRTALKQLYTSLAQSGTAPAVFHCSSGKDRTGWATAVLLSILGVSKETIIKDFVRSNDYILPLNKKEIDDFIKAGGEPGIPSAIIGVKAEYLEAAFKEVQRVYGSMDRYYSEGLDLDATKQKALRDLFLEKK